MGAGSGTDKVFRTLTVVDYAANYTSNGHCSLGATIGSAPVGVPAANPVQTYHAPAANPAQTYHAPAPTPAPSSNGVDLYYIKDDTCYQTSVPNY